MRGGLNIHRLFAALAAAALCASLAYAEASDAPRDYDIPAGDLAQAVNRFSQQSDLQVIYDLDLLKDKNTPALKGRFAPRDVLIQLLTGTGLEWNYANDNTIVLRKAGVSLSAAQSLRLAQENGTAPSDVRDLQTPETSPAGDSGRSGVPEILVTGSKILNMDIQRSSDDSQPYIVIDRTAIERSGALTVDDLLARQLNANSQPVATLQGRSSPGSRINLRGLGTNQTLILVDGRRVAGAAQAGSPQQPDLNGIPLSAIERIEILPTTASGIYGGSATGGVINVVLKRSYAGVETKISRGDTFDGGGANWRLDLSGGFALPGGKTNAFVAGTYFDANPIEYGERRFVQRARSITARNNPDANLLGGFLPPLGRMPNIASVDGSPLFGPGSSSFTSIPAGYTGGLAPLQANAGTYNLDMADNAQLYAGSRRSLIAGNTIKSLMTTVRHSATANLEFFVEGRLSRNEGRLRSSVSPDSSIYFIPGGAPANPFAQDVFVTAPVAGGDATEITENETRRLLGGMIVRLRGGWTAGADYSVDRAKTTSRTISSDVSFEAASAISDGTIDIFRDTVSQPLDLSAFLVAPITSGPWRSRARDAVARAAGPVGSVLGHPVVVSGVIERREEVFEANTTYTSPTAAPTLYPSKSQTVNSLYVELTAPILARTGQHGQSLEAQLAGRYDDYSVDGATNSVSQTASDSIVRVRNNNRSVNPTVSLRYEPLPPLTFRGSYGTGSLPPSVDQVAPLPATSTTILNDPRRGGEIITLPAASVLQGGNPNLKPEDSKSWSAGIIVRPVRAADMRLSIDYTRIDKRDNIVSLGTSTLLLNEALFPDRVVRADPVSGDPFGVGRVTAIDATYANIARAALESYDATVNYGFASAVGRFDASGSATWLSSYKTQLVPGAPVVENAGNASNRSVTFGVPLKFRATVQLQYSLRRFSAGWAARYFDSYRLDDSFAAFGATYNWVLTNGGPAVPSQTYHDIFFKYQFDGGGLFGRTEFLLNLNNVLNKTPPFDPQLMVGAAYSTYGDPRLRTYQLALRTAF